MKRITRTHLRKHDITTDDYKARFPDHPIVSEELAHKLGKASREMSPERREQVGATLGAAWKGVPKSPEQRAKISTSRSGVSWGTHTEEHRKAVAERNKVMWEHRRATGWTPPEQPPESRERTRQGVIEARKRKHWSGPANKGMKLNLTPEQRANRSRKAAANMLKKASTDSTLEVKMAQFLTENDVVYEQQFSLEWERGAFAYDFYIPSMNLLVETDGEYWHRSNKVINRDRIKENEARRQGYEFLRISNTAWRPELIFAETDAQQAHNSEVIRAREVALLRPTLIAGDCVEQMAKLKKASVDLVIADPPYKLDMPSTSGMDDLLAQKGIKPVREEWDKFTVDSYIEFTEKWIDEAVRLLKPTGSMFIFGSYHNIGLVNYVLQKKGIMILNDIAWFKRSAPPHLAGRRLTASYETILWVAPTKRYYFDYEAMKAVGSDLIHKQGKQMRNVWDIPVNSSESVAHPTQKPTAVYERLVRMASREGDTVLDPFAGSGTLGAIGPQLNRQTVLIEQDHNYSGVITRRLSL